MRITNKVASRDTKQDFDGSNDKASKNQRFQSPSDAKSPSLSGLAKAAIVGFLAAPMGTASRPLGGFAQPSRMAAVNDRYLLRTVGGLVDSSNIALQPVPRASAPSLEPHGVHPYNFTTLHAYGPGAIFTDTQSDCVIQLAQRTSDAHMLNLSGDSIDRAVPVWTGTHPFSTSLTHATGPERADLSLFAPTLSTANIALTSHINHYAANCRLQSKSDEMQSRTRQAVRDALAQWHSDNRLRHVIDAALIVTQKHGVAVDISTTECLWVGDNCAVGLYSPSERAVRLTDLFEYSEPSADRLSTLVHESLHSILDAIFGGERSSARNSREQAELLAACEKDFNNLNLGSYFPGGYDTNNPSMRATLRKEAIVRPMQALARGDAEEKVREKYPNVYAYYLRHTKPLLEDYVRKHQAILSEKPASGTIPTLRARIALKHFVGTTFFQSIAGILTTMLLQDAGINANWMAAAGAGAGAALGGMQAQNMQQQLQDSFGGEVHLRESLQALGGATLKLAKGLAAAHGVGGTLAAVPLLNRLGDRLPAACLRVPQVFAALLGLVWVATTHFDLTLALDD